MVKKTQLNMRCESKVWGLVKMYQIHKQLNDREEALEEIIILGWNKYKELYDDKDLKVVTDEKKV